MKSLFRGLLLLLLGVTIMVNTAVVSAKIPKTTDMKKSIIDKKTYYMVKTEEQLRSIGKGNYKMSFNYLLDADIKLTKEWVAIGDEDNPFTGSFNGNGLTISNLKITSKTAKYIGLFGYVEGGSIYNVTLKNVDIDSAGEKGKKVCPIVAICIDGHVYDNVVESNTKSSQDASDNEDSNDEESTIKDMPSLGVHHNLWSEDLCSKYEKITGSLALSKESKTSSVKIDIYADNKLLKSCALKKGSAPISINADVTGSKKLSFEADIPIIIDENGECGDKSVTFKIMLDTKPSATLLGSIVVK